MRERLEIRTLGGLAIQVGGQVAESETRKEAALLVYLTSTGRAYPREVLAEFLWEERTQAQSLANLRHVLTQLRQQLGDYVAITADTVGMKPEREWWLDTVEFETQLDRAGTQPEALEHALNLYEGDFLTGFYVDSSAFEQWATRERERLRLRAMEGLDRLVAHHTTAGSYAAGIGRATQLLQMDSLREETHRQMMRLLALSGQRGKALEQYETCRRRLHDDLDVEPMPETMHLHKQIRAGELAPPELSPIQVQLVTRLTPEPTTSTPHNLPMPATPFIGRARPLAEIAVRLNDPTCSLLTVVGTGGIGKTRLALLAAETVLNNFGDGAFFVRLAPISDPALVMNTVAQTLDIPEQPAKPILETLKHRLRDKHMLLLLDNFEQVIEAAPQVADLLSAAPGLKALVTSREVMNVYGEHVYEVLPMAVPEPGREESLTALAQVESAELFVQRAKAAQHDFALTEANAPAVAAICARLDGLPLAIELAAARVRMFSPETVLARLEDRFQLLTGGPRDQPARLQTLRNAIDWSIHLLDEAEQTFFMRLGVFVGGWTLDAAEAVCGENSSIRALDGLESLLNKSLIRQRDGHGGEPRFWMLETVREYAWERLAARGKADDVRRRHAAYFLYSMLPPWIEPYLHSDDFTELRRVYTHMELDHDNLRAALAWTVDRGAYGQLFAERFPWFEWFWRTRGHLAEARQISEHILQAAQNVPLEVRLMTLRQAGRFASLEHDWTRAEALQQERLALMREIGDKPLIADALYMLGACIGPAESERALAVNEEALALYMDLGNQVFAARIYHNMGERARLAGDYTQAQMLYEKAAFIFHQEGGLKLDLSDIGLGFVSLYQGDVRRAGALFKAYLESFRSQSHWNHTIWGLVGFAGVFTRQGNSERAARLFGALDAALEAFGFLLEPAEQVEHDRYLAEARAQVDKTTFAACYAEGRAIPLEEAIAYALEQE